MSKTNIFSIILVYALTSSTLIIDIMYIFEVFCMKKNYEIICHIKTTIVLLETLELNYAFARKKLFILIFI